jgi:Spx/MgsR family transcriptional regulator
MKKIRVYEYANCSTCKKALKFLEQKKISYECVPIVEKPPTVAELKKMLAHQKGEIKKLFNTSGQLYRELGISDKLPTLSEGEALKLLSQHGKLIKRPFVLTDQHGLVGFKEDEWKQAF